MFFIFENFMRSNDVWMIYIFQKLKLNEHISLHSFFDSLSEDH